MGCGDCTKKLEALRQQVVDLQAVLAELREEYLSLAQAFDDRFGVEDGDEEDEATVEEGAE